MTEEKKYITKKITEKDIALATEFAEQRYEKSKVHYMRRRQFNETKVKYDIMIGALGEIGAYKMLKKDYGIGVCKPDFEVYEAKNKSFDADLTDDKGRKYHCKSQSMESSSKYGRSYILQWGGKGYGHTDKLFRNTDNNDYLIPTEVDVEKKEVRIFGCYKVKKIMDEGYIKPPKVKWLEDTKRAIYLKDIENMPYYERWGRLNNFSVV